MEGGGEGVRGSEEMEGCRRGGWERAKLRGEERGGESVGISMLIFQKLGANYNGYTRHS